MADNTRTYIIKVIGDTHEVEQALKRVGAEGTTAAKGMHGWFGKITPTLGDVRNILGDVVNYAKDFIETAAEEEAVNARLVAVLKDRGTYTEAAIQSSNAWADSMMKVVNVDDEEITNVQAMIAGLTKLSGESLNQATQAALGFAAATGKSNESAAIQIAKFLETGTGLRGIKVQVDKNADAQTKLNALTDATGAGWANLMAQKDTFEGSIKSIGIAWDELKERLGGYITESDLVRKASDWIVKGLDYLTATLDGTNEPFNKFIGDVKSIVSALSEFVDWMDRVGAGWDRFMQLIGGWTGAQMGAGAGLFGMANSVSGGSIGYALQQDYQNDNFVGPVPPSNYRGSSSIRIANVGEIAAAVGAQTNMRLKESAVG